MAVSHPRPRTRSLVGVFVVSAAKVRRVENVGPATTHGQNDMVLDTTGAMSTSGSPPRRSCPPVPRVSASSTSETSAAEATGPIVTTGSGARGWVQPLRRDPPGGRIRDHHDER